MTDLIKRLGSSCYLAFEDGTNDYSAAQEAIDRIEQLVKELQDTEDRANAFATKEYYTEMRAERAEAKLDKAVEALREIASEAVVPVHTKKLGGISNKKMYTSWRALAVKRIDRARAVLVELEKS